MIEPEAIESYAEAHSDPEGDYLYRLWRYANIHTVHGHMASGHLQGQLLKMLVMMKRPQYILEIGTFTGYSAICMAKGLKQLEEECGEKGKRKLYTYEINDELEDFTRPWIEGSDVAEYIDFRIGDAIAEAPKLKKHFEMAFIDGDKRTYCETYDALYPLINDGGIILADNTLWDGHVLDSGYDKDSQTIGIRRFNDHIAKDKRVSKIIIPVRDGLTIIRKDKK